MLESTKRDSSFTMAYATILMIFSVVALMSGERAHAAVDCSSLILNMADCLSFVTSGSTVVKPEGTCCSGLKTVVRTGPECLCEAFKNSGSLGLTLDLSKAASLPSVCKVAAPPSARCGRKFLYQKFHIGFIYLFTLLNQLLKLLCCSFCLWRSSCYCPWYVLFHT